MRENFFFIEVSLQLLFLQCWSTDRAGALIANFKVFTKYEHEQYLIFILEWASTATRVHVWVFYSTNKASVSEHENTCFFCSNFVFPQNVITEILHFQNVLSVYNSICFWELTFA